MFDFKELPKDGTAFELLVRELLYRRGLEVYWTGKGPDGGKDIVCIERIAGNFNTFEKDGWFNASTMRILGKQYQVMMFRL